MVAPADSEKDVYSTEPAFDVIAIGSSAGGVNALIHILSPLPHEFPAAILAVQHLDPRVPSRLADVLARKTELPVVQASDGERIRAGTVYLAPPDVHMQVESRGILSLSHSPIVKYVRPSIDVLFTSVAEVYGHRCLGVILTGRGNDGAKGLRAIHQSGGLVIIENPVSAAYKDMPTAAIQSDEPDYILSLDEIPRKIVELMNLRDDADGE